VPLLSDLNKYKSITSELALVLQSDIIKMNFDFEPAKEETYSINLNKLNLGRFRELGFAVRKANFQDKITLKVEFANAFNEKSELYLNEIPAFKWRDYRIKLTEFKNISDWSEMFNLSFIVENWNTKEKRGLLYIDDIRLIK
jgi:hypothetical protein